MVRIILQGSALAVVKHGEGTGKGLWPSGIGDIAQQLSKTPGEGRGQHNRRPAPDTRLLTCGKVIGAEEFTAQIHRRLRPRQSNFQATRRRRSK